MSHNELLYSKLIRSIQLLELAKANGRIDEKKYQRQLHKYRNKLDRLLQDKEFHEDPEQGNYLTALPIPDFLEKRSEQKQDSPYRMLGGLMWKTMLIIIVAVVAFLCATYFLDHILSLKLIHLVVAFGCPLLYLTIVYMLDKYEPEPKMYVAGAFLWGAICTYLALLMNRFTFGHFGMQASICMAGITEELVKGIALYFLVFNDEYNDAMDAIVYGFAIGLGFAAVENAFYYANAFYAERAGYLTESKVVTLMALRASLCALGHAVFTSATALVLARAKLKKGSPSLGDFIIGYFIAALIHGLFNGLSVFSATRHASVFLNTLLVVGGLWIIWEIIKKTWEKERTWGWHLSPKQSSPK